MTWQLASSMGSGLREQGGRGDVFYDLASAVTSTASYWLCKSALFTWEGTIQGCECEIVGSHLGGTNGAWAHSGQTGCVVEGREQG